MKQVNKGLYLINDRTYIFHSESAANLLTNQASAGIKLKKLTRNAAYDFVNTALPIALSGVKPAEIAEVICLCGGNYYGIKEAFEKLDVSINEAYLGIRRYKESGEWIAKCTYQSLETLPDNATIIIGDTIASGSTMKSTVNIIYNYYLDNNMNIKNLIVYSLAGSNKGRDFLKSFEGQMQSKWPNSKLYFFFAEALFGVKDNGTDLPFHHEETIIIPEMKSILSNHPAVANFIKCSVFDWGDRFKNPNNHYKEFIEYVDESLELDLEDSIKFELKDMRKRAANDLEKLDKPLIS